MACVAPGANSTYAGYGGLWGAADSDAVQPLVLGKNKVAMTLLEVGSMFIAPTAFTLPGTGGNATSALKRGPGVPVPFATELADGTRGGRTALIIPLAARLATSAESATISKPIGLPANQISTL